MAKGGKSKKKAETVFLVCEETGDYNYTVRRKPGGEKLKLKKYSPRAAQAHAARREEEVVAAASPTATDDMGKRWRYHQHDHDPGCRIAHTRARASIPPIVAQLLLVPWDHGSGRRAATFLTAKLDGPARPGRAARRDSGGGADLSRRSEQRGGSSSMAITTPTA